MENSILESRKFWKHFRQNIGLLLCRYLFEEFISIAGSWRKSAPCCCPYWCQDDVFDKNLAENLMSTSTCSKYMQHPRLLCAFFNKNSLSRRKLNLTSEYKKRAEAIFILIFTFFSEISFRKNAMSGASSNAFFHFFNSIE